MKRFLMFFSLCLCLILINITTICAQATATAELRGRVLDPNGAAVPNATVTATNNAKGTTRTVNADSEGNYVILSLQPSTYTVKVEAPGFATKTYNNVMLEVGQQSALDVDLALGQTGAVVDVLAGGEQQLVDTERTQQSTVISARQLNNLPINRRNFLDFALLTPGVNDADNINDSTDFRVAQSPQSGWSFGQTFRRAQYFRL
jgi:hypothetical protein